MNRTIDRNCAALFLSAIVLASSGAQTQVVIQRPGATPIDELLMCARAALGRPVVAHPWLYERNSNQPDCSRDETALRENLRRAGIVLVEGSWGYLIDKESLPAGRPGPARLEVIPQIRSWTEIAGSRPPTVTERDLIAEAVFRNARPISHRAAEREDGAMRLEPELTIDIHPLRRSGSESVIAVLTRNGAPGRLVYGEFQDGKYRVLWDSPFYDVWLGGMAYEDVNGDGNKEILLSGRWDALNKLAVLSVDGTEFTRRSPCLIDRFTDGYTEGGALCPLVGTTIEILPRSTGPSEIRVDGDPDMGTPMDKIYQLVNQRYVAKRE